MSYTIEYQHRAFRIDLPGASVPRFAVAIEAGSNNCYSVRNGIERRSRDWELGMLGTRQQVMRQAVQAASNCEVRGIRLRGRAISPESYILKVRKLLRDAVPANAGLGYLVFAARVDPDHVLASAPLPHAFARENERWCGSESVLVRPQGMPEWAEFFELVHDHLDNGSLVPWRCGHVLGLPSS
jgi:hypothetical protein